jgi:hypothetical protein
MAFALRRLGRIVRRGERQENRGERQEQRQEQRDYRQELRQRARALPLEQKLLLAQALGSDDDDDGAGYPAGSGLPMSMSGQGAGRAYRGSPVGGRAPNRHPRLSTTVPAGSTGTLSQLPTIISPSFFRPERLIVTPRALPTGVAGFVTALNIGTINQLASLGETGFEAYDPQLEGGQIEIADIAFGMPVQLVAVLTNSTGAPIDVSWGGTMYGERLG